MRSWQVRAIADGRTLLMSAALADNATLVRYLVGNATQLDLDINAKDSKGIVLQGITLQRIVQQGIELQGIVLQGIVLQGIALQGIVLQGIVLQ